MRILIFLFVFLTANMHGLCQGIISPASFLNSNNTMDEDESGINVYEMPGNSGFLFPMTSYIPSNLLPPGNLVSSAKLVKSDNQGTVTGTFLLAADTLRRRIYRGMHARTYANEVLFFIAEDSVAQYGPISKGILLYHLDSATVTVKSVDTFSDVFPVISALEHWNFLQAPSGSIYASFVIRPASPPFSSYDTRIIKVIPSSKGAAFKAFDINSQLVPGMYQNGLNYGINAHWNSTYDSVAIFMSSGDSILKQQIFRLVTIDTALVGLENTNILNGSLQYKPGLTVSSNIFNHGIRKGHRSVFVGPFLSKNNNSDGLIGMLRYDLNSQTFDRVLIIPDSSFSHWSKHYLGFENVQEMQGNIFCLGSDLSTSSDIFFNTVPNHLYVGKSDTSLSGWNWYKYIGNPGMYHVPYKILPTSDGGCIITCGIYDFAGSANRQRDIYVIRLRSNGFITNVANLSNTGNKSLSIYPVPAQNQVFLSNGQGGSYDFFIWDVTGKLIFARTGVTASTEVVSLEGIAPGSFIYKASFKNGMMQTGRIIKQ